MIATACGFPMARHVNCRVCPAMFIFLFMISFILPMDDVSTGISVAEKVAFPIATLADLTRPF